MLVVRDVCSKLAKDNQGNFSLFVAGTNFTEKVVCHYYYWTDIYLKIHV